MEILVIEDDEHKFSEMESLIRNCAPQSRICRSLSLVEARKSIRDHLYDLVIIDMAIPSHTPEKGEGAPISLLNGGIDIVLEISLSQRDDRCVIVTQYPDIEISGDFFPVNAARSELARKLQCEVEACIYYEHNSEAWKGELKKLIGETE